jgi:hypothetical protein
MNGECVQPICKNVSRREKKKRKELGGNSTTPYSNVTTYRCVGKQTISMSSLSALYGKQTNTASCAYWTSFYLTYPRTHTSQAKKSKQKKKAPTTSTLTKYFVLPFS